MRAIALLLIIVARCGAAEERPEASAPPSPPPPTPVASPSAVEIRAAIDRGVWYLLAAQNPDGSWGSARRTKDLNIYAPVPGAHQGFHAATTSLCLSALIELDRSDPWVARAIDRGEDWLFRELPHVRRATPDTIYNVWAHAYSIQALVRILKRHAGDGAAERRAREAILGQIDLLERYETLEGGWCYYDLTAQTQRPTGTIGFVTATVLVALREAKEAGVEVPERIVRKGMDSIFRQRKPDFSYLYGEYLKWRPQRLVNRPAGSLGRSQACNFALRVWGDRAETDDVLRTWLRKIHERNLWLDIGRKRPIPHESWAQVAGYFFYYGHYYAARCLELLPAAERATYGGPIAAIIIAKQEKDGSWFDYPFYDYHQQYGTAFALMTLARCLPAREF
jgi:hypothetical protein